MVALQQCNTQHCICSLHVWCRPAPFLLYAVAFLAGHHTRGASWLSALPPSSLDGWLSRSYSSGLSTVRQSACQHSHCLQTVRAMRIRGQLCCELVWLDAGSLSVTVSNRTAQRGAAAAVDLLCDAGSSAAYSTLGSWVLACYE